jgi:hypothetical protein
MLAAFDHIPDLSPRQRGIAEVMIAGDELVPERRVFLSQYGPQDEDREFVDWARDDFFGVGG